MNKLAEMTNPGNMWEYRAEGRGGCMIIQIWCGDDDTSVENDDKSAERVMAE